MKYITLALTTAAFLGLSNCTVYRSPERKQFESDAPGFLVKNLKPMGCSNSSIRSKASTSKLITIYQTGNFENQFLWEYLINSDSYFESDNLSGVYCAFENS